MHCSHITPKKKPYLLNLYETSKAYEFVTSFIVHLLPFYYLHDFHITNLIFRLHFLDRRHN